MLSRERISDPQPGHRERGFTTDSPAGTRAITTFRNDPTSRPRTADPSTAAVVAADTTATLGAGNGDGPDRRRHAGACREDSIGTCGFGGRFGGSDGSGGARSAARRQER